MSSKKWSLVIPMANEESDFFPFTEALTKAISDLEGATVFFVVDNVSKDRTLELCNEMSKRDSRFVTVWAPENRNVVDAYMRGYREALKHNSDYIIEMDAGLSHDPGTLKEFIRHLAAGSECVYGSRFISGGSMGDSPPFRKMLSMAGTVAANFLLGTKLRDMTSGYQGFQRHIVTAFTDYRLRSKAHFYQTEIRYLLRKRKQIEIPIKYRAPSPRVSKKAITNSIAVLLFYFWRRITFRSVSI